MFVFLFVGLAKSELVTFTEVTEKNSINVPGIKGEGNFFIANYLSNPEITLNNNKIPLEGELSLLNVPAGDDLSFTPTDIKKSYGNYVKFEGERAEYDIVVVNGIDAIRIKGNRKSIVYNAKDESLTFNQNYPSVEYNSAIKVNDSQSFTFTDGTTFILSPKTSVVLEPKGEADFRITVISTARKALLSGGFDGSGGSAGPPEPNVYVTYPAVEPPTLQYMLNDNLVTDTLDMYRIKPEFVKVETQTIKIPSDGKHFFVANNLLNPKFTLKGRSATLNGEVTLVVSPNDELTVTATEEAGNGKIFGQFVKLLPEGKTAKIMIAYAAQNIVSLEANENIVVYNPNGANKKLTIKSTASSSDLTLIDHQGATQLTLNNGYEIPSEKYAVLTAQNTCQFEVLLEDKNGNGRKTLAANKNVIVDYPAKKPTEIQYILGNTLSTDLSALKPPLPDIQEYTTDGVISVPGNSGSNFFIANNLENYVMKYNSKDIPLNGKLTLVHVKEGQTVTLTAPAKDEPQKTVKTTEGTQSGDSAADGTQSNPPADVTNPAVVYGYFAKLTPKDTVAKIIIVNSPKENNIIKDNENVVLYNALKDSITIKKVDTSSTIYISNKEGNAIEYDNQNGVTVANKEMILLVGSGESKFNIEMPGKTGLSSTAKVNANIEVNYKAEPKSILYVLDGKELTGEPDTKPETPTPDTKPEKPEPDTKPETPTPDTKPEKPEPDTKPETPTPDTPSGDSNQEADGAEDHTAAIVGGVVGGIAGLAIIGGLVYFFVFRKKNAKVANESDEPKP